MADLNTALIAFVGVLAGGYVNNFVAEDFRRFRDSQALAGALAGELDSHGSAVTILRPGLDDMLMMVKLGQDLALPEWPEPPSPIFEANAERIGLLGSELAKDVAFVYEQIRAFRVAFHLLSKHHKDMPELWRESMVENCTDKINSATTKGEKLVSDLTAHANKYKTGFKVAKWCGALLLTAGIVYLAIAVHHAGESDPTQCTTTLDHGTLHTTCK